MAPGFIDTDMTRTVGRQQNRAARADSARSARAGGEEEIAYAVAFLAFAAGAYITGSTMHVNGRMYVS